MRSTILTCVVAGALIFSGCQAVFTYSPLEFLQRDMAALPEAQQVTRAEDALGSGDVAEMGDAYDTIALLLVEPHEPELDLLAADLAFGASGMTEVITSVLQDPEALSGGATEALTAILDTLDTDLIAEGVTHVQEAAAGGAEISESQYVVAGAALLASAVEAAGSFEAIADPAEDDPWYQDVQDAEAFFAAGGVTDDLLSMFNL
jgi:hypothetical protein